MPTATVFLFFFFNDTATTEIYPLSLHDALPIWIRRRRPVRLGADPVHRGEPAHEIDVQDLEPVERKDGLRSEEHTSELQSRPHLVCRLLLEKKKKKIHWNTVKEQLRRTHSVTSE